MRIELLPGLTNIIRFPVERRARPSLNLLRDIAPDVREVLTVAEGFRMALPPHDLRERVDAETAAYIAAQVPANGPEKERQTQLTDMLDPTIERAVTACRTAHDGTIAATTAQQTLLEAEIAGGYWLEPLEQRAEALMDRAAHLLVQAHVQVEEAEGVARAVDLARRSIPWTPRNYGAEDDALITLAARCAG